MPEHKIELLPYAPETSEQSVGDSDSQIAGIIQSLRREIGGTTGSVVDVQSTQVLTPRVDIVAPRQGNQLETNGSVVVSIESFRDNRGGWINAKHRERVAKKTALHSKAA